MKKIIYMISIMVFAVLFIPAGCTGDLDIIDIPAAAEGKGFVTINLEAGGRTVLPTTRIFASFEAVFTPVGNDLREDEKEAGDNARLNQKFELEVGNWTLDLKVFNNQSDADPVATGRATFTLGNKENKTVQVALEFVPMGGLTAHGYLTWNITNSNTFPAGVAARIGAVSQTEITLTGLSGQASSAWHNDTRTDPLQIPAGYYWVTVRQERDRITPLETNISNWRDVRSTGITRSVTDDIIHIYPGQTTHLTHVFGANDYFNGLENVWLVGHNDQWDPQLGTAPEKNTNGTFTWKFQTTAPAYFRFSLTDTTGLTGANMSINRGAWFIPAVNNTDVSLVANNSNSMDFIGFNSDSNQDNGYGRAWRLSNLAYYVLTLDPVSRSFNVQTPVELEGVRIITDLTDVSADVAYTLSAEATGRNINGGNFTWSVVKDPAEDNPTNITRTAQVNTDSYTATSTGSLVIDTKQTVGDLVINVSYNVGGQTKTDTITLNFKDAKPLAPVTAAWGAANTGNAQWQPHTNETNVGSYNIRLFKGSGLEPIAVQSVPVGAAISYVVDFRTKMLESIAPEDGSGPFPFTYTVEAVSKNEDFLNSIPAVSAARNVTRRSQVTSVAWGRSPAVSGEENGRLFWNNTTETGDYSIQVYRNIGSEKVPVGGSRNASRGSSYSEYHLANAYIPSDIRYHTVVAVTAKGDPAILQVDSLPVESPPILYTVFGNSRVWNIVQGGTTYVAGAEGGKIGWSDDGVTWTLANQSIFGSGESVRGIAYRATPAPLFVAVAGSRAAHSSDGKTWTAGTVFGTGDANQLNNVIYDGSQFVAVGHYGQVIYSTNGTSWTRTYQGGAGSQHLYGLANNGQSTGKLYVAAGAQGRSLSSTTGTSWEWREDCITGNMSYNINNVTFGAGIFVIAGQGGVLKTATTATINANPGGFWNAWTSRTSGFGTTEIFNIVFTGNRFYAVGANGRISHSTDGAVWISIADGSSNYTTSEYISAAISLGDGKLLLSGNATSNGWGKMTILEIP